MLRLVFLGPPGVGKGTQAQLLAQRYQVPKISTGDILRDAVSRETALGRKAKSFMDRGQLVPDEVIVGVVQERLGSPDCRSGYILDGFPRTLPQAQALSQFLQEQQTPLHRVLCLEVSESELLRRLSGRRSCPHCQRVYHSDFNPPRQPERCDACGSSLLQRADDQEETVKKRLGVYQADTAPLIAYYDEQGLLAQIDGQGAIEAVQGRLVEALKTAVSGK